MSTNQRKLDHIDIVLNAWVDDNFCVFERFDLPRRALPECDLATIDSSTTFLWKQLSFPFMISSMTWWPQLGKDINRHLAQAAEQAWVALWLGSMRIIEEDPTSIDTFAVKKYCPSIPLLANVGLVQLNYGFDLDACNRLIDSIKADGIFFHINALQEAAQPEWDTNFWWLLEKLEKIIPNLHAPALVKETGNGIDAYTAQRLKDIGIQWIDVSWRGGISRPAVEWHRRHDRLGETLRSLGTTTDNALQECSPIPWLDLIAWWGIRNGIHGLKSMTLWATLFTAGAPFLQPALESRTCVYDELMLRKKEFTIGMRSCGWQTCDDIVIC